MSQLFASGGQSIEYLSLKDNSFCLKVVFFKKKYLLFLTALGLHYCMHRLSLVAVGRLRSSLGVSASHCGGFSSQHGL